MDKSEVRTCQVNFLKDLKLFERLELDFGFQGVEPDWFKFVSAGLGLLDLQPVTERTSVFSN